MIWLRSRTSAPLDPSRAYDLWAGTYDRDPNPLHDAERPLLRDLLPALHGARVLDVGAGTGRNVDLLLGAGAREVIAVDLSDRMLERLRARWGRRVATVRAGVEALPFDPASFDAALVALVLAHVEVPARALAEVARVLRPGGFAVVTDLHPEVLVSGTQATFRQGTRLHAIRTWPHAEADLLRAMGGAGLAVEERGESGATGRERVAWGVRARRR